MAESDTVGDFSKRMRPITPNEIAAMRRIRLCQNKYKANIKLIKNDYLVSSSHLIREKFEAQIELASISISELRKNGCRSSCRHNIVYILVATTGIAFENKQCHGEELSRPPSYMSNFFGRLFLNLLKPARLPSEPKQYSGLFAFVIIYFLLIDEKVCILKNNKKRIFSINKQPFSLRASFFLFLIFVQKKSLKWTRINRNLATRNLQSRTVLYATCRLCALIQY